MKLPVPTVKPVWIRGSVLVASLVMVATLASLAWPTRTVQAALANLQLKPQPEAYAELYFDSSLSLPTVATAGRVRFAFTIHNENPGAVTYPYEVLAVGANGVATVMAHGTVSLDAGAAQDVPLTATLPRADTAGRAQVVVYLPNQQQQIDFWLGVAQ